MKLSVEDFEMSDVKRYDAVHLRYEESNIRYGEGCEVEVVAAYDFDRTVSALRAELNACTATLPGTLYMDPPDGGDVSVPEQLARMAADAARFRHLSDLFGNAKTSSCEQVLWGLGLTGDVCDDLGVIVDACKGEA